MEWKKAIAQVLQDASEPLHYAEIADRIAKRRLRKKAELGATPANTVAVMISSSINNEGNESPFVRVSRGYYSLRAQLGNAPPQEDASEVVEEVGIIRAFGMFWSRNKVYWRPQPQILGKQQPDSVPVNFCEQVGVYFLHDIQGVVYVGRSTDQNLGKRLYQHTIDRLNGRWDRFSWFGLYPVSNEGSVSIDKKNLTLSFDVVISTLEAALIEGLEPRLNRRRGDFIESIEFIQHEDPSIEIQRKKDIIEELKNRIAVE